MAGVMDSNTRESVILFMDRISARYDVSEFILFGSRARDDFRADSDADVAVLIRGTHGDFVKTKLAMADIAYDVLLEHGIRIQPLPIWEDEWAHPETYPNSHLLQNIEREGIRL